MNGWIEITIKDLGRIVTGKTPPTEELEYFNGSYSFVSPKDMEFDSRYIKRTLTTITIKAIEKFKNQVLPKDSVMFTCLSYGFGKIGLAGSLCLTNQQINSIIVNSEHDFNFVYYLLRYSKERLLSYNAGIVTPIIPKSLFEKVKVIVPENKFIECKIGAILSAYDDLIENNLKRIKLLEELAQRTYEEWFVKFRVNGEQLAIDESTGLPVGWQIQPFNTIVHVISGFPFKSGDYVDAGEFKIVTIKNVQDGYFVSDTTDSIDSIPAKVKEDQKLKTNDIILSLTGNVGRVCLVYGEKYLLNQRVAKIQARDRKAHGFIYFLLRSRLMITALENLSNGAAQQNLSPINMGNMKLSIPDRNIMIDFGLFANPIIEQIGKLNIQNSLLKQSRDILLPRLMNGSIL